MKHYNLPLKNIIEALQLATPWALAPRFEDTHTCVPASLAGALALKKFSVKAEAVLCAAMVRDSSECGVMGLSKKEVYTRIKNPPPFEEWCESAHILLVNDETPLHMAIRVKKRDLCAFVDLTICQLNMVMEVPRSFAVLCRRYEEWPSLEFSNGLYVQYEECPHETEEVRNEVYGPPPPAALADDFYNLMLLALQCGLDQQKYLEVVMEQAEHNTILGLITIPINTLFDRVKQYYDNTFPMVLKKYD